MVVNFTQPDTKTFAFPGHKVDIYYPKMATVHIFDVGKSRELLEEFLLIGFGTSRANCRLLITCGSRARTPSTAKKPRACNWSRNPRGPAASTKLELWVADNGYPIQQKFYLPAGDYELATYSSMKINPEFRFGSQVAPAQ